MFFEYNTLQEATSIITAALALVSCLAEAVKLQDIKVITNVSITVRVLFILSLRQFFALCLSGFIIDRMRFFYYI
jgi:hypothetical protein